MTEQYLPYAGTSGWSGTETSRVRAEEVDTSGVTGVRQRQVFSLVRDYRETGRTVQEVRANLSLHHGQASSVLTALHKVGVLQRLTEVRNRCKVYVVPECVAGREVEAYARRQASRRAYEYQPRRGDAVAEWVKDCRNVYLPGSVEFEAIDAMLNQYRLDADTGSVLGKGREH